MSKIPIEIKHLRGGFWELIFERKEGGFLTYSAPTLVMTTKENCRSPRVVVEQSPFTVRSTMTVTRLLGSMFVQDSLAVILAESTTGSSPRLSVGMIEVKPGRQLSVSGAPLWPRLSVRVGIGAGRGYALPRRCGRWPRQRSGPTRAEAPASASSRAGPGWLPAAARRRP